MDIGRQQVQIHKEYRTAVEMCPTPLMLVSQDGSIMLSNRQSNELFGYEEGELNDQTIDVLVPAEVKQYHPELRNAFFEVPTSRSMGTGRDLFGVRKDGTMIPLEIGLDPIAKDDFSLIMVSIIDIRERKMSEAKVRQAIDAATSAMIMVEESGKIDLINEQTQIMFGYEGDELIGQSVEKLVPDRYLRKHKVYRASYQSTRDRRSMGAGRDLFGVRKDGTEFPIEIGLTPIDGQNGSMVMATIIDITQRKEAEMDIRMKNQELQRLNMELSEFAYSTSHDLKAPLSSIAGTLQFVEQDLESGDLEEVKANVNRAKGLASRLAVRIEDMLAVAKAEKIDENWSEFSVAEAVSDVWQILMGDDAPLSYLRTDYNHVDPIWTLPPRFYVILENLLSNAVKYRDQKKEDSIVEVKTWNTESLFVMTISDNGIGIPEEHQEKIFQLFKRVSDSDEPGSGLGLSLVEKNTLRLGGTVDVKSTDDGTVFTIALPMADLKTMSAD